MLTSARVSNDDDAGDGERRRGVDPKEIRELIELVSRSKLSSLEYERDGVKLKLVKPKGGGGRAAVASPAPTAPLIADAAESGQAASADAALDPDINKLNSPIVGTFYRCPSPDLPPFVEVGGRVAKGQVICIVEAMKVMNEIESEIDAEVIEVLVADGQPVEYGETLFHLRPLS